MTKGYENKRLFEPQCASEEFLDWLPPKPKNQYKTYVIRPSRLPCKIKQCYRWRFSISEKRKVGLLGIDGVTIAGIKAKCLYLPGREEEGFFHPKLATRGERLATPEVFEELDLSNEKNQIEFNTEAWEGWRLSYRKCEPEKTQAADIADGLDRQIKRQGWLRAEAGVEGSRRKNFGERMATAKKRLGKKRVHEGIQRYRKRVSVALAKQGQRGRVEFKQPKVFVPIADNKK